MKLNVEFQAPDRKKKIKRIIAREGLILLGIISFSIFLIFVGGKFQSRDPLGIRPLSEFMNTVETLGMFMLFLGYPSYLLIRFILWAIKTLRER